MSLDRPLFTASAFKLRNCSRSAYVVSLVPGAFGLVIIVSKQVWLGNKNI
jgi:hypothetical protein